MTGALVSAASHTQPDNDGPYAHSCNANGRRQDLREHLEAVARDAERYAAAFGASDLAHVAGLWHDLGKYHPAWQSYLLQAEAGGKGTGPDHKGAGSVLAQTCCEPLAFLIAGHHGGLPDKAKLKEHLLAWQLGTASEALLNAPPDIRLERVATDRLAQCRSAEQVEMLLRMLFSALVDADFLDTERHFQPEKAEARRIGGTLSNLWDTFQQGHAALDAADTPVNRVRREVYECCLSAARAKPGFFRLTVPTGGGKTLSSLAFALSHAVTYGKQRVIAAVPYTTITEQTADAYRDVLPPGTVVEHHSSVDPNHIDEQTREGLWGRLACENWDAPVVVTTTVQLFESLFASATSRCRKVHRLSQSVIILDEAQCLPPPLLTPILSGLRELVDSFGATVLLCTATQPALDDAPGFRGLPDIRDAVPNPGRLFTDLRRVNYQILPPAERWSWSRVAEEVGKQEQSLAILNTVASALSVLDELDDPDALHISTRLCGAHRRDVLWEVGRRLATGAPCRLTSTQIVEAGVDIDFPVVLRAIGPLDRIVQAAGRCNREGRLARGRMVVFHPEDDVVPSGPYKTGTWQTAALLGGEEADLDDPQLYERYFRAYYAKLDLDERRIQALRSALRFAEVADQFRMIADDTAQVVVEYGAEARGLIDEVRESGRPTRALLRQLQPFLVSVRSRTLEEYRSRGLIEEVAPGGLLIWHGQYDHVRGLTAENDILLA